MKFTISLTQLITLILIGVFLDGALSSPIPNPAKGTKPKAPAKAPVKAPVPPKAPVVAPPPPPAKAPVVAPPAPPVVAAPAKAPAPPPPPPPAPPAKPPTAPPPPPAAPPSANPPPSRPPTPPPPPPTPPPPSRPSTPEFPDPAEGGCVKQKTCETCIAVKGPTGQACGFQMTPGGGCAGLSTGARTLATSLAQCKALESGAAESSAADATLLATASAAFTKMSPHVFGTERGLKKTSGRHIASSLLSVNKNAVRSENNPTTGLSKFSIPPSKKVKTTFNDDGQKGKNYALADVTNVCTQAIVSVLKNAKKTSLPVGGATTITGVVVPVPGVAGTNICVGIQGDNSCFPLSTAPATGAVGSSCTGDAGVGDDS